MKPVVIYEPTMPPTIPPGMTISEWRRARRVEVGRTHRLRRLMGPFALG